MEAARTLKAFRSLHGDDDAGQVAAEDVGDPGQEVAYSLRSSVVRSGDGDGRQQHFDCGQGRPEGPAPPARAGLLVLGQLLK
jgi:hypothetical protein